jgi:hypothetical protein
VFYNRPVDRYGTALPPVSGDEGVYFCDGRTIWVTTGGVPTRISYPIERFLLSETTLGGSTVGTAAPVLGYADGRLYVTCSTATGSLGRLTLVYDPKVNAWMMFTYQTGTLGNGYVIALHRAASAPPTTYCFDGGGGVNPKLFSLVPGATADDAAAIPWSYTTGYSSAGGYFRQRIVSSGVRKKHFKTDILGTATNAVTHQVLALNARANDVADTGGTVTLGSSATARGSRRRGARGTHFAQKLSGTGPGDCISRLTHRLAAGDQPRLVTIALEHIQPDDWAAVEPCRRHAALADHRHGRREPLRARGCRDLCRRCPGRLRVHGDQERDGRLHSLAHVPADPARGRGNGDDRRVHHGEAERDDAAEHGRLPRLHVYHQHGRSGGR